MILHTTPSPVTVAGEFLGTIFEGTTMILRHLAEWLAMRLFFLSALVACNMAQADVILWGQGGQMPPEVNTPYVIRPGESRTQPFFYKDPFEVRSLRLHLGDNPLSSGFGRVTVWLAGESIYSGPAVGTIAGLSKRLEAGWHPLTVRGLENQSQWVGSAGNPVGSTFNGVAAPGLNLYVSGMSLVPEPDMVVLLVCCCVAGIICAWRASRGER